MRLLLYGILTALPSRLATACGGFFCQPQEPVLQAGENIAFGVQQLDGDRIQADMVVQINYEGPTDAFGWLLPVPTLPEISVVSDSLFDGLFASSRPTFDFQVDNSLSTTCTEDMLRQPLCSVPEAAFADAADDVAGNPDPTRGDAIVRAEGSVGPFDYVVLEAAQADSSSVYRWLQDNGYDQPPEAEKYIEWYSEMEMLFVALRLTKDPEITAGNIQPVALRYEIEGNLSNTAPACVPLQITSIAATENMPIQVYLLSDGLRGFSYNLPDLELDYRLVDWITCSNTFGQNCYLNSVRDLFEQALDDVDGRGFFTEYAGPSSIVDGQIEYPLTQDDFSSISTPLEFLQLLVQAGVPDSPYVHTVILRHIPNTFSGNPNCFGLTGDSLFLPDQPFVMENCIDFVEYDKPFDINAAAKDVEDSILAPAREAQAFVAGYSYLTRVYAQMSPEEMQRDVFFGFDGSLPQISNQHSATGAPKCNDNGPIGLDIFVEDLPTGIPTPYFVEAVLGCFGWSLPGTDIPIGISPAFSMSGFALPGNATTTLFRDENGLYQKTDIDNFVQILDDRVMDQNVPEVPGDSSSGIVRVGLVLVVTSLVAIWFV